MKMAKPWCKILAREGVRFQCHYCKAVWELRVSEFLLWFIMLRAGGSLCPVSDKEMGAFSTLQIKKRKRKPSSSKTSWTCWQCYDSQNKCHGNPLSNSGMGCLGELGKASLFVILGQGFPLASRPPILWGEPARGFAFFPQVALLPIWSTELLFAAAALIQKGSLIWTR